MRTKNNPSTVQRSLLARRKATFTRRSKGLMKKAYELSVLAGVDICVILLPPSDDDGSASSSSAPPPRPLAWPEEPSDLHRIIRRFKNLPTDKRRMLQKVRRQNSELAASCLHCESIGTMDDVRFRESVSALDKNIQSITGRMQRDEEKECRISLAIQGPIESENAMTSTHQSNHALEMGQLLPHDNLAPSPLTTFSSECWDSSVEEECPPACPSDLQFGDKMTSTHQANQALEMGQSLLQHNLAPSPLTTSSSSECWDFPVEEERPLACPSEFQFEDQSNQALEMGQSLLEDSLAPSPLTLSSSACWDFCVEEEWQIASPPDFEFGEETDFYMDEAPYPLW